MISGSRALQLQSMSRGIQKKYAYAPAENINVNLENKAKQLFGKLGLRHEKIPTLNHERKLPRQIEGVYKKDKLSLKKNPRVSDKKAEAVAMHEIYHHTQRDKGLELGQEESQANMIEKAYLNENQERSEELDFDLIYAHTIKQFYEHEELEQLVRVLGGDASSARRVYGNAMETIAEFNTKQKTQKKVQEHNSQLKKSSVDSGVRYKQSDIKYAFLGVSMNDLEEAWDTTVDGAEYLVDKTADGIEYAADKTVDSAIYVKDKAVEGAEAVVEAVESIADWTEEQIRELLSGLFETCASVANWIWGVIQGEFNSNPSVDQIVTDIGIGFIPVVGQLADGRDAVAISIKLSDENEQGKILNWVALIGILIGIVPGAGDAVKGVIKIISKKTGDFISAISKLLQKLGIDDTVGFIKKIDWAKLGSRISSLISKIIGAIKTKIDEIINLVATVLNKISSITPNDVLKTIEGFKKYLVDGYNKLVALESFIGSKVDEAFTWLKKVLGDTFPTNSLNSKSANVSETNLIPSLSSKVSTEELNQMYNKAPQAKIEIDDLADTIADSLDGSVAKAPIKSKERAMEKIINEYKGNPKKIKDLARNTIIVPENKIDDAFTQLEEQGAKVKKILAEDDALGYSGVNAKIKTESGIWGEVQVNTPEMIYAKEPEEMARKLLGNDKYNEISQKTGVVGGQGHKFYEEWRVLVDKESPQAQAKAHEIAKKSKLYYESIRSANGN